MSSSSTSEKDLRSLDEDSGHDSIGDDVYSSPAEDRERIEHLETVVTWIRQEVNNLKQYDRDILEELWKIRAGIQDIQRAHNLSQEAESKYLDDSLPAEEDVLSLHPKYYVPTKKASPERSPSPAQSHTPIESTPPPSERLLQQNRCNTLDLVRTAPTHLMMSDEQLLEEFFGSDQVEKLNQFKKSLDDEKTKKEEAEKEYEAMLRRNVEKKLQIPVNPNRKSSRYSCDVVTEMEQLRARLHETAFKELEEFDKKFSPKLLRPGINPASGEASHSRQGSLDSSFPRNPLLNSPQLIQGHRREFSLPAYMEPSTSDSPQSASGNSSPFASRSATQLLKNQVSDQVGDNDIRSPTPPLQYGHIRQLSASSASSGSGTFSPPPVSATVPLTSHLLSSTASSTTGGGMSHNMPLYGGSGGALNRYQHYNQASKLSTATSSSGSSPSQQATRAPNPNSSHFHSLKLQQPPQQESHHVVRRMASAGGGSSGVTAGGAGPGLVSLGSNLSPPRNVGGSGGGSGLVSIGSLSKNSGSGRPGSSGHPGSATNNSSLNRIRNAVPISPQQVLPNPVTNGVPLRRHENGGTTQPHYSTTVIKKRKSNPSPDHTGRQASIEDTPVTEVQTESNSHPSRSGTSTPDNNVCPGGGDFFPQPGEQKGISKNAQQQRLMSPIERISYSPKMTRKPMMKVSSASSTALSSPQNQSAVPQPSLMLMKSDSNLRERSGPSVYDESIEPYMSSDDLKTQMKYYKYTPYTDCNGINPVTRQDNPESTWC